MHAKRQKVVATSIVRGALALLLVVSLAKPVFSDKPGSFPDIPVTTTLNITGDISMGTNYGIQSDGNGSYFNEVASVSSILQGGINNASRDWILDTRSSTSRTALIDLRNPLPNGVGKAPFAWEDVPLRIIAQCHLTLPKSFPGIALNQSVTCPLFVVFNYAGASYRLAMYPPGYPETNYPLVTCTAANNLNVCAAWMISPITQPDATVRNIAQLQKAGKNGSFSTVLGDFYVSFNFTVTNP